MKSLPHANSQNIIIHLLYICRIKALGSINHGCFTCQHESKKCSERIVENSGSCQRAKSPEIVIPIFLDFNNLFYKMSIFFVMDKESFVFYIRLDSILFLRKL
jgi:hypothetical protein